MYGGPHAGPGRDASFADATTLLSLWYAATIAA